MAYRPEDKSAVQRELIRRRLAGHGAVKIGPGSEYWDDPALFAQDFIRGLELTPYQQEILRGLHKHQRYSARSSRGAGKSTTSAIAVLHFCLTREMAGIEWKVITTASAHRQLKHFLWPEIRKWATKIDFAKLGIEPWRRSEHILDQEIKLTHGSASAAASDDPTSMEGAHADELLGVFDESKAIKDDIWNAAEGWFSAGHSYVLAVSTPGGTTGRFYEIHSKAPGLEDWTTKHVTLKEVMDAGRLDPDWVDQRKLQWGADSPLYRQHVLAQFADINTDGVIPIEWIEAAVERWNSTQTQDNVEKRVGVDVARHGNDSSVICKVAGSRVTEIISFQIPDIMAVAGQVIQHLDSDTLCTIDCDGMGVGVFDRLREIGYNVESFHGAPRFGGTLKDQTGELTIFNYRSFAWWRLREMLDPRNEPTLAIPDDAQLIGDLAAPSWDLTSSGEVRVEPKQKTKVRIGRSPDRGDALVYAMAEKPSSAQPAVEYIPDVANMGGPIVRPDTPYRARA